MIPRAADIFGIASHLGSVEILKNPLTPIKSHVIPYMPDRTGLKGPRRGAGPERGPGSERLLRSTPFVRAPCYGELIYRGERGRHCRLARLRGGMRNLGLVQRIGPCRSVVGWRCLVCHPFVQRRG